MNSNIRIEAVTEINLSDFVSFCSSSKDPDYQEGCRRKVDRLLLEMSYGPIGVLARENEMVIGILQFLPLERSPVNIVGGDELFYLNCLWIKEKRFGEGIGRALIENAEMTWKKRKGVVVKAWDVPPSADGHVHMPISFFRRFGFAEIEKSAHISLMLKQYQPVSGIQLLPAKSNQTCRTGKAQIDFYETIFCLFSYAMGQRLKKACEGLEDEVDLKIYDCSARDNCIHLGRDGMDMDMLVNDTNIMECPLSVEQMQERILGQIEIDR